MVHLALVGIKAARPMALCAAYDAFELASHTAIVTKALFFGAALLLYEA